MQLQITSWPVLSRISISTNGISARSISTSSSSTIRAVATEGAEPCVRDAWRLLQMGRIVWHDCLV